MPDALYQHSSGNLYRRIDPPATIAEVYWMPERPGEPQPLRDAVFYVPSSGEMPPHLAAEGCTCYATPLSRWNRRFSEVT